MDESHCFDIEAALPRIPVGIGVRRMNGDDSVGSVIVWITTYKQRITIYGWPILPTRTLVWTIQRTSYFQCRDALV